MDKERLDFGSLDPSRDVERWERMIAGVVAGGVEARGKARIPVAGQLFVRARLALAIAAAAAFVVWIGAFVTGALSPDKGVETQDEPAYALARWESEGKAPETVEILQVLGVRHDDE